MTADGRLGGADMPVLTVSFYSTDTGREPVREWLKSQPDDVRAMIGFDIWTVQRRWPLGMPLVRKIEAGLWELRSRLDVDAARVFFTVDGGEMTLLHGFIKKSMKTPAQELQTARSRLARLRRQCTYGSLEVCDEQEACRQ